MKKLYVIVSPEGEVVYPPVYTEQEVYLALPHYAGGRVVEIYQLNSRESYLRAMGPFRSFLQMLIFLPICAALILFPLYVIYDEYSDYLTVNEWERVPAMFVPTKITKHTTKHRLNAIPVGETSYYRTEVAVVLGICLLLPALCFIVTAAQYNSIYDAVFSSEDMQKAAARSLRAQYWFLLGIKLLVGIPIVLVFIGKLAGSLIH